MDLRKILFLGGHGALASVQVRCLGIARQLGCDVLIGPQNLHDIPDKYSAFVCVKPGLSRAIFSALAKRGPIIWDIIDTLPPREMVSVYLASTKIVRDYFSSYGRVALIPHYHCNFERLPNPPDMRQPVWIGSAHWQPKLTGFKYDAVLIQGMRREDVVKAHRRMGIGLNFRNKDDFMRHVWPRLWKVAGRAKKGRHFQRDMYNLHLALNSGIKLINCLGFGTPSISADEPAYHEVGEHCTIFSGARHCARWVKALKNDGELYMELRRSCLRKAPNYHVSTIAEKYRALFSMM